MYHCRTLCANSVFHGERRVLAMRPSSVSAPLQRSGAPVEILDSQSEQENTTNGGRSSVRRYLFRGSCWRSQSFAHSRYLLLILECCRTPGKCTTIRLVIIWTIPFGRTGLLSTSSDQLGTYNCWNWAANASCLCSHCVPECCKFIPRGSSAIHCSDGSVVGCCKGKQCRSSFKNQR